MEDASADSSAGVFISQQAARDLVEAAKEAVIHLREQKAAHGAGFQGDRELELLVNAILAAEGN